MARRRYDILNSWSLFSGQEKRNIALYIVGIMLYKFGLEAFNGSITALATNRYDHDADVGGYEKQTFERIGLLAGLNQAMQCVGSIMIAPLIKRWPTRIVLSAAITFFALLTAVLLIVDGATGGHFKPDGAAMDDYSYYGDYKTDGMIPIYTFAGVAYGMVEVIRRIIPRDIVGGNVQKLRRMDALVHIFYEVSGTASAFCTALALIPSLGNNMSFIITPILFTLAAIVWFFISNLDFKPEYHSTFETIDKQPSYIRALANSFILFLESIFTGARILFTSRRFIWLLPGYTIALYAHRYLENGIAPAIAKRYLNNSAWSQIIVGGSNFGELLGAGFVFLFTNFVPTPLPWLRIDALTLLIVWYLPFFHPAKNDVRQAWIIAATFIPISFGWAAGDVSLAAYIQASLARREPDNSNVSSLGAVMAFLYSTYIIIYAITSPILGKYIDQVSNGNNGDISTAIQNVGGVQFTIISATVLIATFVPKGAFSFNPRALYGEILDEDIDEQSGSPSTVAEYDSRDEAVHKGLMRVSESQTDSTQSPVIYPNEDSSTSRRHWRGDAY